MDSCLFFKLIMCNIYLFQSKTSERFRFEEPRHHPKSIIERSYTCPHQRYYYDGPYSKPVLTRSTTTLIQPYPDHAYNIHKGSLFSSAPYFSTTSAPSAPSAPPALQL